MKASELEKMSAKELRTLREQVDSAVVVVEQRERAVLKDKLMAMAAEHGMSLSDLVGGGRGKGKKLGSAEVKYRNPKNADETWSGRGRKPNWLVNAGGDPERFRV